MGLDNHNGLGCALVRSNECTGRIKNPDLVVCVSTDIEPDFMKENL
jgi:hypothetical protein